MGKKISQIAEIVGKSVSAFIQNANQSDQHKIKPGAAQIALEMVRQFQALRDKYAVSEEEEKGDNMDIGNARRK